MAPALTEPLSPTEKLSDTATTTVQLTRTTRRSRAAAEAAAEAATVEKTTPSTKTTTNTLGNKEKKIRNNSTATQAAAIVTTKTTALQVSTTRVTRSKDNANNLAAIPVDINTPLATTSSSSNNKNKSSNIIRNQKEPMGLSAALNTSNKNNLHTSKSGKKDKSNSDSTEKILADLATNIEEAITAEICLRKQLCDVNLSSEEAAKKTNGGTELKDIDFVITSSIGVRVVEEDEEFEEKQQEEKQHMDPLLEAIENNALDEINEENLSSEQQENEKVSSIKNYERGNILNNEVAEITESSENATTTTAPNTDLEDLTKIIEHEEQLLKEQVENEETFETTGSPNLISSNKNETTTTVAPADEDLDNIEARLSQLDGDGIIAATEETTSKPTTLEHEISNIIPTTTQENLQAQLKLSDTTSETRTEGATIIENIDLDQQKQNQKTCIVEGDSVHYNIESTNINMGIADDGAAGDGTVELVDQEELVEEVLKVLKGFDPSTANADTLNDLNALFAFSDVYQNINSYEDANVSTATAATLNVTSDNANTSGDCDDGTGATSVQCNVNWLENEQQEIIKAQQVIQRKMDFLVRKLRKTQARYMCKHASEEIAGVIEYAVRAANNKLHSVGSSDNSHLTSVISARPPPEVWQEERESPIPSAEVYALLRKLEISAKAQQLCKATSTTKTTVVDAATRKPRKSATTLDITATTANTIATATTTPQSIISTVMPVESAVKTAATALTTTNKELDSVIPTFDMLAVKEMSQVAGMLQTEMREVQLAIDSDATESSSGCESADELITYNNQIQQPLEIEKRAAWRYARDRAAIAARWSWLLSQISDLDIKIRQHTDLYNDVLRKKGPVIHDNSVNAKMGTTYVKQRQIQQLQQFRYEQQIMPLHHQQLQCEQLQQHQLQQLYDNDVIEDDDSGACRTRGYLSKSFRKRKILTTANLHTISKKAARPTTIKCGCQWPMQPCTLCTGRSDPTAPRELPNTMTKPERVALLDSGYHPVLSFPEDVSHTIHFEAIARLSEWQQRVMRCQVKSIAKSVWKAERAVSKKHDSGNSVKRRYIKKKDRLAAEAASEVDVKAKVVPKNGGLAAGVESCNLATCTTTPLVANKRDKMRYQTSSLREKMPTTITELMDISPHHQIEKDYPVQKYENYNNNRNSTTNMISRRNNIKNNNINNNNINYRYNNHNRNRKAFSSSSSSSSFSTSHNNNYQQQQQQQQQHCNNNNNNNNNINIYNALQQQVPVQYNNSNGNSSSSETTNNILHINENWDYMTSMRSRTASPTHANSTIIHKHERSDKKRNSYDIDNIVIPYSVAAATRVEIIPYKEIPTPKWRVISKNKDNDDDMAGYDVETEEEDKEMKEISRIQASKPEEEQKEVQVKEKVEVEARPLLEEEKKGLEKEEINENSNKAQEKDKIKVSEEEAKRHLENKAQEKGIEIAENEEVRNDMANIDNFHEKEEKVTIFFENVPVTKKRKVLQSEEVENNNNSNSQLPLKVEHDNTSVVEQKGNLVLQNGEISKYSEVGISNVKTECTEKEEESALNELHHENEVKVQKQIKETTLTTRNYEYHEAVEGNIDIEEEDDENQVNENISDEIMAKRHERALTEERRKFQTYLKFPWTTRSRANRRGDSRAESSGANTPDPASPAPAANTSATIIRTSTTSNPLLNISVKDQENHIPSTATASQTNTNTNTTTTTPFTSVESTSTAITFSDQFTQFTNKENSSITNYRTGVRKRRRTTSSKREQETRSLTPDSREFLPPYEPLKFPLSNEAFDNMIRLMPMDKYTEANINGNSTKFKLCNSSAIVTNNSRKSVLGGFGSGRTGLRRQSTHTSHLLTRSNSLRTRLSNRPYVLNNNHSSVQHKRTIQGQLLAFEDNENMVAKKDTISMHHINGKHLLSANADDMAEETEDETETCEVGDEAAETECDDDDDDEGDEEELVLDDLDDDDDDDDGFLKHPLATADYNIHDQIAAAAGIDKSVTALSREQGQDSTFAAYAGPVDRSDIFSERDMDSSEAEPFQEDDDPNDPEWGNVRMRKRN